MPAHKGVAEYAYPGNGNQIRGSQMMGGNCRPPRETAAKNPAALPVENARILKSRRLNIGDVTRFSMMKNAMRKAAPMTKAVSTRGDVNPIEWCRYGWMP